MEASSSSSSGSSNDTSISSSIDGNSGIVTNQRKANEFQGIQIGNPFTLKVGQVFTGFGLGCGIGIGVGRPINLGTLLFHFHFHILGSEKNTNYLGNMDLGKLFKPNNLKPHLQSVLKNPCNVSVTVAFVCVCMCLKWQEIVSFECLFWSFAIWV